MTAPADEPWAAQRGAPPDFRAAPMVAGALSIVALWSCGGPPGGVPVAPPAVVTAATARLGRLERRLCLRGTVVAREEAVAVLESPGGRITSLVADVGDEVETGSLLAEADDAALRAQAELNDAEAAKAASDVAQAEAALAEAQAVADDAARALEQTSALVASGSVPDESLRQRRSADIQAAAHARGASASLDAARADRARVLAQGRAIAAALARLHVRAPVGGRISERAARIGAIAQPTEPLFRIATGDAVEVVVEIPERELGQIVPGMPVATTIDQQRFDGTLRRVDPIVERGRGGAVAHVALPAASTNGRMIGRSALVDLVVAHDDGALIPLAAVQGAGAGARVLLIGPDGVIVACPVQTGLEAGDQVCVHRGLAAGNRVVATASALVTVGEPVVVSDPAGDEPRP